MTHLLSEITNKQNKQYTKNMLLFVVLCSFVCTPLCFVIVLFDVLVLRVCSLFLLVVSCDTFAFFMLKSTKTNEQTTNALFVCFGLCLCLLFVFVCLFLACLSLLCLDFVVFQDMCCMV